MKPEEVPYGWMLLECFGKTKFKIRIVKGRKRVEGTYEWIDMNGNTRKSTGMHDEYFHTDKEEYYHFKTSSYNSKENGYLKDVVHWYQLILDRIKESGVDVEQFSNRKPLKEK